MTTQNVKALAERVENPFAAPTTTEAQTAGAGFMQAQAASAMQGAVIMAKRFPRDPQAAMQRILDACTRTKLAEAAEYAYPRGGETVTGPSIRLAETIAQQWGNLDFGIIELSQEGGRSHMMAYAWDLETNTRQQKVFVAEHIRATRQGNRILSDPRDVYELTANLGARRLRACILGIVPADVIEAASAQCRLTVANSMEAPAAEIAKMIEAFKEFGIPETAVKKRLGKNLKAVTAAEVIRMRQIFVSLRDGMSKPGDWFDLTPDETPPAKTGNKAALKEKLKTEGLPPAIDPKFNDAPRDVNGVPFDPSFHVSDAETGDPVANKDGTWRKRPAKRLDDAPQMGEPAAKDPEPVQGQAQGASVAPGSNAEPTTSGDLL